jgi:hypothetical protein
MLAGARSLAAIGEWAGAAPVHLLAVMDHTSRRVLGQAGVDHTTNEITQFQPLLDHLDLTATVGSEDMSGPAVPCML